MDIVTKITLVASLIWVGYSASQFLTSYDAVCEKVEKFKKLAVETDSSDKELVLSNSLITICLSIGYTLLAYFSGLALWVILLIALKLLLTCRWSFEEIHRITKKGLIDTGMFKLSRTDAILNAIFGLMTAIFLVA